MPTSEMQETHMRSAHEVHDFESHQSQQTAFTLRSKTDLCREITLPSTKHNFIVFDHEAPISLTHCTNGNGKLVKPKPSIPEFCTTKDTSGTISLLPHNNLFHEHTCPEAAHIANWLAERIQQRLRAEGTAVTCRHTTQSDTYIARC